MHLPAVVHLGLMRVFWQAVLADAASDGAVHECKGCSGDAGTVVIDRAGLEPYLALAEIRIHKSCRWLSELIR